MLRIGNVETLSRPRSGGRGDGCVETCDDGVVAAAGAFAAGELARFADSDIHGFHNTGGEPFTYLSVTSPPIDFTAAYQQ